MSIDPEKLLVLFVIAVLVLGPERLPQMARALGRGLAELRKYTSAIRSEVDEVLAEPRAIVNAAAHEAEMRSLLHSDDTAGPTVGSSNGSGTDWLPTGDGAGPYVADADGNGRHGTAPYGTAAAADDHDGAVMHEIDPHGDQLEWVVPQAPAGAPDDPLLN